MKNLNKLYLFSKILSIWLIIILMLGISGCGGNKLVPLECEKYIAKALNTPQYNVQVTTSFRTSIIFKTPAITLTNARNLGRSIMEQFASYAKENSISDFGNDSLLFYLRLDTNPDINMKWHSSVMDFKEFLDGKIIFEEFLDRCIKEENWSEDFG